MDLPLWDDQHYSFAKEDDDDDGCCDFSFVHKPDTIEEDALNEKCCVEALRRLNSKADEDILKLEEDILMLQCQLLWDDQDWSEPCSKALKQRIRHLDTSIQSLNKDKTNGVHDYGVELEEPGNVPLSVHALLKPLLENYYKVKGQQQEKEKTTNQMSGPPAIQVGKTKLVANTSKFTQEEAKERIIQKKSNKRVCPSMEPKEKKISQSSNATVKDLIASTSIGKSGSRGRGGRRNTAIMETSGAKVLESSTGHENKVAGSYLESLKTGIKIAERVKVNRRVINKSSVPNEPLVKNIKKTDFGERTEALEIHATETTDTDSETLLELYNRKRRNGGLQKVKKEPNLQVQLIEEMKTAVAINQDNSSCSTKPERGPGSKSELALKIADKLRMADEMYLISSKPETSEDQQKEEIPGIISKKRKREDASPEVAMTSFSSRQKKRKITFNSVAKRENEGLKKTFIKLEKFDCDSSNEAAEVKEEWDAEFVPHYPLPLMQDMERMNLNELKTIAKNNKIKGYSKLRKEELLKLLGFELTNL